MAYRDYDRRRPEDYDYDRDRGRFRRLGREGYYGREGEPGWEWEGDYGRRRPSWEPRCAPRGTHRGEEDWERDREEEYGYENVVRRHAPFYGGYAYGHGYPEGSGLREHGREHRGWTREGYGPPEYRREGYRWGRGPEGYVGREPPRRYEGRGPKNYQRPDERIREDVNDRLTEHPDIDATDVNVQVRNGEVTLRGEVDSRYSKRLAEDIADSVTGVKDVHNELQVKATTVKVEEHRAA